MLAGSLGDAKGAEARRPAGVGAGKVEQFQFREIPEALLDEAVGEIKPFATAFVSGLQHVGSGTFATIQGRHGILTARHVWDAIRHLSVRRPFVCVIAAEGPHTFELEVEKLTPLLELKAVAEDLGPDIQFLEVPAVHVGTIKARKSFVNLTSRSEERRQLALSDHGFLVVAGFPGEFVPQPEVDSRGSPLVALRGGFVTGLKQRWDDGECDLFETRADRHAPGVPRSYGGVSGAGVWRVEMKKKPGVPIAEARIGRCTFMGVSFYQLIVDDDWLVLRHNGPKTIYNMLNRLIPPRG